MARYWIARPVIYQSPNQLWRAYIFNFQEDMWHYVYKNIYKDTDAQRNASLEVFNILAENRRRYLRHLDNPTSDNIINNHLDFIEESLNDLLLMFGDDKGIFYQGVRKVHNEFAVV